MRKILAILGLIILTSTAALGQAAVQGTTAAGSATLGNPVLSGVKDGSGNAQFLPGTTNGAYVLLRGNTGATLDAAGQNATSALNEILTGLQFNTTPTTITSGNMSPLQGDSVGDLLVKLNVALPTGSATIGAVTQASGPWTNNWTQVNGTALSTGSGAVGTGTARVAVGTDSATIAGSAPGTAGTPSTNVVSVQGVASGTAVPVSGTFWQATQPVSAASLPLPTGASTSAKQPALGTAGTASSDVITVQGIASMTKLLVTPDSVALPANQSVNVAQVAGTNTVTGGVAGLQAIGGNVASASADAGYPVKTGGVFNTTQPTVTTGQRIDNQSTARGASIVATGADTFNVTVNAALPAGSATIGAVTQASGPWTNNLTQVGGTAIVTAGVNGLVAVGGAAADGSATSGNPVLAGMHDGTNARRLWSASAANQTASNQGTNTLLVTGPGGWSVNNLPATATQATITKAAGAAGVRHVCTSITATLASATTAAGLVNVYLRDGASGAGTIIWAATLAAQASNGSGVLTISGLNIVGSAATGMTLEFSAAGATGSQEAVSMTGYDCN